MGKDLNRAKPSWWDSLTNDEKLAAFDAPPEWRFEGLTDEQKRELSSVSLVEIAEWENPDEEYGHVQR